ncbi:hypothetical protein [Sediminicola arcticus]|jgi:hypothetical protein|uniref:DUF1735 domain-containing protein n=1 Tax=Sediminicola arcticus TaxID=1574308 RepID=A0ABV2SY85_9FLAO
MKKYILILFASVFAFTSCEEELLVYDNVDGQTLVAFASNSYNLEVQVDGTGTLSIPVNASTISTTDRNFTVSVIGEETTTDPTSYSFDSSVTIPANSYEGTLVINGQDNNVEIEAKFLVLRLAGDAGVLVGPDVNVRVYQVCPVDETFFTGRYEVTIVNPGVFGAGTFGVDGVIVDLAASGFNRTFTANYFADSRFRRTFTLTLTCNQIVVPRLDMAVGCGGNSVNLVTGPPSGTNGVFDSTDDTSFTVNLTDNVDSDCGGSPVQASYIFTKI